MYKEKGFVSGGDMNRKAMTFLLIGFALSQTSCIRNNNASDYQEMNSYLIKKIAADYVWNFDETSLNEVCTKLMSYQNLKAIFIYSSDILFLYKIQPILLDRMNKAFPNQINQENTIKNDNISNKVFAQNNAAYMLEFFTKNTDKLKIVRIDQKMIYRELNVEIGRIIIFYSKL